MVRLTPKHYDKVWGSTRLEPWFPNPAEKIGEVWFAGVDSPLLIKFLFTEERLSVQVHPNDEQAKLSHGSLGKTEMWHVLRAEPGAQVAAGFRREINEGELRAAAGTEKILDLLEWFDARAGDTFFIPAGTVHAIGGGLVLCEIQENSDITYRLYDYGRPRPLQIEEAIAVSHLTPHAARSQRKGSTLASCEYFITDEFGVTGNARHSPSGTSGEFWIVTQGNAEVGGVRMQAGEAAYIPAGGGDTIVAGEAVLLRTFAAK